MTDTKLRASVKCYLGDNPWSEFNELMVRYHADKRTLELTLANLIADKVVVYDNFKYNLKGLYELGNNDRTATV